jgi:site-specific recombinase XerD
MSPYIIGLTDITVSKYSMSASKPVPLYPTYSELLDFNLADYPEIKDFLGLGQSWRKKHWLWGFDFLKYIGRNKSEHTYTRFRNEIERFLLWAFIVSDKPIDGYRKTSILEYADFCWRPPVQWIGLVNYERFEFRDGYYHTNPLWAPFRLSQPKANAVDKPDKKKYRPSQQSLKAVFTGLSVFYKYLMGEEFCYGNPAEIARKDCRYFIADTQVKEVKRLGEEQWDYVLSTAIKLADQDHKFERSLFVVAALKTLFLRISELSERKEWSPVMSHFWEDENQNWWLKVYGKGRKLRDITVPPGFLVYLQRYRQHRNLQPLPHSGENSVLVEKLRGQGGMSSRHLARLVQSVFDESYIQMKNTEGENKARKLRDASTHWLRHTGASMEIERGRALKDVSEDLGHSSMSTTDTVYVQTENKKRAESGKTRSVE